MKYLLKIRNNLFLFSAAFAIFIFAGAFAGPLHSQAALQAPSGNNKTPQSLQPLPSGAAPNYQNSANYSPAPLQTAPAANGSSENPANGTVTNQPTGNANDFNALNGSATSGQTPHAVAEAQALPSDQAGRYFIFFVILVVLVAVGLIWFKNRETPKRK